MCGFGVPEPPTRAAIGGGTYPDWLNASVRSRSCPRMFGRIVNMPVLSLGIAPRVMPGSCRFIIVDRVD